MVSGDKNTKDIMTGSDKTVGTGESGAPEQPVSPGTRPVSLREAVLSGRLNYEGLVRAVAGGAVEKPSLAPHRVYTDDELRQLVGKIEDSTTVTSETGLTSEMVALGTSEVQIARVRIPGSNIWYLTIVKDGEMQFTRNAEGKIDLSKVTEGIDDVVDKLAGVAMFDPVTRKGVLVKGKKSPGKKRVLTPGFKPTRDRAGYVKDPAFERWLEDNADALSSRRRFSPSAFSRRTILTGWDDLESVISDGNFLAAAKKGIIAVEVEPVPSYIASLRPAITKKVKRFYDWLKNEEGVRSVAGKLLGEYINAKVNDPVKLRELCEEVENARSVYWRLDEIKGDQEGYRGEHYMICFRQMALAILYEARRMEGVEISQEELNQYETVTEKWIALAKGADMVRNDRYIQTKVVPGLKVESSGNGDNEETATNRIFNAVCNLGQFVLDPKHTYDTEFLRYVMRGLGMHGLLETETTRRQDRERSLHGAVTDLTDGLKNLVERYGLYNRLIHAGFERKLEHGDFDEKGLKLNTQAECRSLFRDIYDNWLEEREQNLFRTIQGEDRPLVSHSEYLTRLGRAEVGINRDYYLDKVKERRKLLNEGRSRKRV